MLSQPNTRSNQAQRPLTVLVEELVDIRTHCLGSTHHPVRLSIAALVSAFVLMAALPPASPLTIGLVSMFLLLSVYLLFVADAAIKIRPSEPRG